MARMRIDIPNSADTEWKIDIRKSTARPPVELRGRLLRLAEDIRQRARRVFAHRVTDDPSGWEENHWPKRGGPNMAVGVCAIESARIIRQYRVFLKKLGRCYPGFGPCCG